MSLCQSTQRMCKREKRQKVLMIQGFLMVCGVGDKYMDFRSVGWSQGLTHCSGTRHSGSVIHTAEDD